MFNGQSCAKAGVKNLDFIITDTATGQTTADSAVPCNANGVDGMLVVPGYGGLAGATSIGAAGSYPFTMFAPTTGATNFFASGTLYENGYTGGLARIDLGPEPGVGGPTAGPGTLIVDFAFGTGDGGCMASGVDQLQYFLTDETGALVAGSTATLPCASPLSATFSGLNAPDLFFLNAFGLSNGAVTYELPQYALAVYPGVTRTYSVDVPLLSSL
jgi:hypothetical protein